MNANDVYAFVLRLKAAAERDTNIELAEQLDNALHLGSSALEILGRIRVIVTSNREAITILLGPSSQREVEEIIVFVDKAYGR